MTPTIQWIGSPNFTPGREGSYVDRIVIHWMDGTLATADTTFQDVSHQTSAHYGVENSVVHQYVNESDTAFHAGDWSMNVRSIGIEHSAQPGRDATEQTYQTSAQLIADICARHNIPLDREHIIKHSEVIPTECPGTVDVDKLIALAKEVSMQADAEFVKYAYLVGLHRDYAKGEVSDQEINGQVGRRPTDILNDMKASKEWLTGNDYWLNGPERIKEITTLQQQVKQLTAHPVVIQDVKPQEAPIVNEDPATPTTSVKPGWQTTEFWLTALFNVLGFLSTLPPSSPMAQKIAGYAAMATSVAVYIFGRSYLKSK